jgi:hypothetical protein
MINYNFFVIIKYSQHQEEIKLNFKKYAQSHLVDNFGTKLSGSQLLSYIPPLTTPNCAKISGQNCNMQLEFFMGYKDNPKLKII